MIRGKSATNILFIPDFSGQASAAFASNMHYYLGKRFFFFEGKTITGIKVFLNPTSTTWQGATYTLIDTPAAFTLTLVDKEKNILIDSLSLSSINNANNKLGRPAYNLKNIDWEASYIKMVETTYSGAGTAVYFQIEFN